MNHIGMPDTIKTVLVFLMALAFTAHSYAGNVTDDDPLWDSLVMVPATNHPQYGWMTECNLKLELTLDKVDTILNRLLQDNEISHSPIRDEAIKYYNKVRLSMLEGLQS